ncbi:hypothetical protein [Niallia endozanthoxylica]|uniref:Uncharacterized protein n=1 Tax=Niallia endozanthoxylica TaxID=2036016 RepID=A0A5J5HXV7_9BACI|nr:hypothetical protein [Niallia endozanthoxylica]KAA9026974.1 hypothetical protein F4V44_06545 [Niallia endozanthoxylica]
MATKRHSVFNLSIILIPWLTLLFIGKKSLKRYSISGIFIVIFEIINHLYGHRRKWWKFYDFRKSFIRDELPFSVGPYMPLSMWLLKYSYGNFKKFIILNAIADGLFAFLIIDLFKKMKVIRLNRLSHLQFFFYLHYKAYLLYGVQYLVDKIKGWNPYDNLHL